MYFDVFVGKGGFDINLPFIRPKSLGFGKQGLEGLHFNGKKRRFKGKPSKV